MTNPSSKFLMPFNFKISIYYQFASHELILLIYTMPSSSYIPSIIFVYNFPLTGT